MAHVVFHSVWSNSDTLKLYSDSAGSADLGCGVYFNGKWAYFPWPRDWHSKVLLDITFLEMIPILLSICLWGQDLRQNNIRLMIDNEALVSIINKQTSRSKPVMLLLRRYNFNQSWPSSVEQLILFIASLSAQGFSYNTAQLYIRAIGFKCKSELKDDITKHYMVSKVLEGLRSESKS